MKHPNIEVRAPIDIVLIEDQLAEAKLIQLALKSKGFKKKITWLKSGEEVLKFFALPGGNTDNESTLPKLILLDLNLPQISGLEILELLKGNQFYKQIPVVVLSNSCRPEDILAAYAHGANSYIQKPSDFFDFEAKISVTANYWFNVNSRSY